MSTHTLVIAEELCDRIGIIQRGKLLAEGTVNELKELAGQEDPHLESIFLNLTGGDGDSPEQTEFIHN
jgi:ABC-2 type transport system ATP-binding protein